MKIKIYISLVIKFDAKTKKKTTLFIINVIIIFFFLLLYFLPQFYFQNKNLTFKKRIRINLFKILIFLFILNKKSFSYAHQQNI
jgi:hypothetical protein